MTPTADGVSAPALSWFAHEVAELARTARVVWGMVPRNRRLALVGAVALMTVGGLAGNALAFLLGGIVDRVEDGRAAGEPAAGVMPRVFLPPGRGGGVHRRPPGPGRGPPLSGRADVHPDRAAPERPGGRPPVAGRPVPAHARAGRGPARPHLPQRGRVHAAAPAVVPRLLPGPWPWAASPLGSAAVKQPWVGLAIAGVIPCSIALTVWQLVSQKRVRLNLMRVREDLDGTVVEQLTGLDYIRVANTRARRGVAGGPGGRTPAE